MYIKKIYNKIISKLDIYPFILIFLTAISHIEWFNMKSILFANDWQHRTSVAVSQIINFGHSTWLGYTDFGYPNIQIGSFLPTYIWGLIGNYDVAVKLTYLIPIAILSVLAPYYLLKYIIKDRKLSFLGALLYGFSTYILMRSTGHLPIAFVYSLTPFILLFFIKLLNKFSFKNITNFSLIYSLGCFYEIRIMYIVSFVLFIYFILFVNKKEFWLNKFKYLFLAGLILLANLFWLLPILLGSKANVLAVANRGLWGSQFFSMLYSLAFFDGGWTGGHIIYNFILQPIKIFSWFIPLISIFSLFQIKREIREKKKYILFFAVILLIGLLLTKQAVEPFPNLYLWLYDNFPGFNLFRLADKFYLLLGVGYLGLFVFGAKYIFSIINKKQLKVLVFIIFTAVLLINIKPLVTRDMGGLFDNKEEPQEYEILDEEISKGTDYYRTLWVPFASKWAYYDLSHPKISLWELFTNQRVVYGSRDGFDALSEIPSFLSNFTNPYLYSNIFQSSYGKEILDMMGVKYLIIPMQLSESEDRIFPYAGDRQSYINEFDKIPYLTKEKIGGIDTYENKDYKEPIFAFSELFNLGSINNLDQKYDFINNQLNKEFNFVLDKDKNKELAILNNLFEEFNQSDINDNKLLNNIDSENKNINLIYTNKSKNSLFYNIVNNKIKFFLDSKDSVLLNNSALNIQNNNKIIFDENDINPTKKYYIDINSQLIQIQIINEGRLDFVDENTILKLYSENSNNFIPNASFQNGLWKDKVGDCNNRDNNPVLDMRLIILENNINQYLQLEATRHIACTTNKFNVQEDAKYLLSFDYQGIDTKKGGYYLAFNNKEKTVVKDALVINNQDWNHFEKQINVPAGVNSATIYVYAYESDGVTKNIVNYDNFYLKKLVLEKEIKLPVLENKFEKKEVVLKEGENVFEYKNDNYDYKNIISNPSFELGPWNEKVGDCHNYDDNPIIAMNFNRTYQTDGLQSLQLEATRHTACSKIVILVKENTDYLLSFDYQGENAQQAGFYIGFNDEEKININEKLEIENKEWNKYEQKIKIPSGVDSLSLYIYAYESDKKKNNIVRYDNFKLIEVPDLVDKYYLVSEPEVQFVEPDSINFDLINPTKKLVHIKGATTPFFLAMSESYHAQWQVQMNNQKIQGLFNKWWPFAKPDKVENEYHYKLNGFLNSWYIDTENLCQNNTACTKNADGSYDIEMVIEFWPQRWFYLGLLISGTTLLGCLWYLGYDLRKRRKIRKNKDIKKICQKK